MDDGQEWNGEGLSVHVGYGLCGKGRKTFVSQTVDFCTYIIIHVYYRFNISILLKIHECFETMEKSEIAEILRRGVGEIISRASPPGSQERIRNHCRSSHFDREFLFVIAGESRYLYNDHVYPCLPGMLFLIDSGVSHGHKYTREDKHLIHLWGYFYSRRLHVSIIEVMEEGQYKAIPEMSFIFLADELFRIVETRWNLLTQRDAVTEETVAHYMKGPINAVLEATAFQLMEHPQEKAPYTQMEEVKEYILSQNGRECSLEHLAAMSGYTRCYLARKFRDATGITIGKYIEQVRLKYIQSAMKRGIRQKEMAYELGFSSPASFWNWLQNHKEKLNNNES